MELMTFFLLAIRTTDTFIARSHLDIVDWVNVLHRVLNNLPDLLQSLEGPKS